MLVCNTCERNEEEVFIAKKDGICKKCKDKIWRENNKEHINKKSKEKCKKYRENNKEKIQVYMKEYYLENKDKLKEYKNKDYYLKNKERLNEKNSEYYKNNIDNIRKQRREYFKNKRENDYIFKFRLNIRKMINRSFKRLGYSKSSKTNEILGCSFEELITYLESKFENWMTWENKGLYNGELDYGWDIDHIIPLSSAKTEQEVLKLNHYTNLQPLCSKVNRDIKRDTI